jgi:hypothetical protein
VGIYGENLPPTLCETSGLSATLVYVRWFLHNGPKGVSYVQVLPKEYSKSSVHPMVPRTSAYTVCRAYVQWSPHIRSHYKQQRTSAKPSVRLLTEDQCLASIF